MSLSGPSGSRGALGALMTCLRAARAQGVFPSFEESLQGGLVPLPLLQQALVHKHDQVSIAASTSVFVSFWHCQHYCLFLYFVSCNCKCLFPSHQGEDGCTRPSVWVPPHHWSTNITGTGPDSPLPTAESKQSVTMCQTADGQPDEEGWPFISFPILRFIFSRYVLEPNTFFSLRGFNVVN